MTDRTAAAMAIALCMLLGATSSQGQSRAANPTVKVLPRATSVVPAECEEGLSPQPQPPRVQVEEIPVERDARRDMLPPPSSDLRDQLRDVQEAGEANNRARFEQTLERARGTVASYPTGGERNGANEAVEVFADVKRLWDYQFANPTGAFFDAGAQDGALLAMLSRYRGYDEFIRRHTIVDANGTRFYPARESRDFLLRESAQRLARLGVRAGAARPAAATEPPSRPATAVTTPTPATTPRTAAKPPVITEKPRATTSRPSDTTASRSTAPRTKKSATRRAAAPRTSQTERAAKTVKPRATTPAKGPAAKPQTRVAETTSEDVPLPPGVVSEPPSTAAASEAAPATSTAVPAGVPESTATATETSTVPAATDTMTADAGTETIARATETAAAAKRDTPSRSRNIILPIVLILAGIGLLIVLFRASS